MMLAPKAAFGALGLAAACLLPAAASAQALQLKVEADQRHQQIDGFGTALAWWLDEPYSREDFRDMYYGDLGASMLRMDFHFLALRDPSGDMTRPVELGPDIDANIALFDFDVPMVNVFGEFAQAGAQKKIDDFKLIGSLWSPPHWMKGPELHWSTGEPNGNMPRLNEHNTMGGTLIDTPENLEQFGRYVAAYVKGMEQAYGVPVEAISLQNELIFSEEYNSAVYTPELYVKALKATGREFARHGITTRIQGPEDVGVATPEDPWILWRQMQFINAVREDPEAAGYLDIYSIHGYAGNSLPADASSSGGREMWDQYVNGRSQDDYPNPAWAWWEGIGADGKPSWMTEQSGNQPDWIHLDSSGANVGALWTAVMMHEALVYGDVSAYLHWQTSDDKPVGTPTLTSGTDTTAGKYNAAKHFYRYIRPGAQRVDITPGDTEGILASAYVHDEQETLTVVLINTDADAKEVTLDISSMTDGFTPEQFLAFRSSEGERFADLPEMLPENGILSFSIPGQSVMTLYGVVPEPAMATGPLMIAALLLRRRRA